jgi:hypothetical protein
MALPMIIITMVVEDMVAMAIEYSEWVDIFIPRDSSVADVLTIFLTGHK